MANRGIPAASFLGTIGTAAVALAAPVQVGDFTIAALADGTKLAAEKNAAVAVMGGDLGVAIAPPASDDTAIGFGIRHVDEGTHVFAVGLGQDLVGFQCDLRPVDAVDFQCDLAPGTLVVQPQFAATKRWRLLAIKDGVVVHDLAGLEGAFTIVDFEDPGEGGEETLDVEVAYGVQDPDAWTITIHHDDWTVCVTPELVQPFTGLPTLTLRTKGLADLALVDLATW